MCAIVRRMLIPVLAALALAVPAEAGTIVVELTFLPGKLAVTSAPATVSGTRAVPLTVADGRGSGGGWTLEVRSSKPVRVAGITARCAAGSTCTLPSGGRRVRERRPARTA